MANIDNVQLPDGSSYNIVDNTSGFATQNYVDSAVSSVTKTTIGLGNVDNTSDLNKPISTATQTALDTLDEDKADKTDIATVESGSTASRAYSVGELVYVGGTLYKVKTAIASGATFTVGTNIEVTNVSKEFKELKISTFGSAVILTPNVDYITPCDGYFKVACNNAPGDNYAYGYVNSVNMITAAANDSGAYISAYPQSAIFVRKGSVIKYVQGNTGSGAFYPLQ